MADVALLAGGVQEAPLDYAIPGAQEIALKALSASYDGSGAAGDFVPTLQAIAPNGAVLFSCPTSSTVTAGASADVSWFPRGTVSKGGGGITEIESLNGSIIVASPFGPVVDLAVNLPATSAFELVQASGVMPANGGLAVMSWGHVSGAALLNYTNPLNPTVVASGVYAWSLSVQGNGLFVQAGAFQSHFAIDLGHSTEQHWWQTSPNTTGIVGNPGFIILPQTTITVVRVLSAGRQVTVGAAQGGGAGGVGCSMFGAVQRLR